MKRNCRFPSYCLTGKTKLLKVVTENDAAYPASSY